MTLSICGHPLDTMPSRLILEERFGSHVLTNEGPFRWARIINVSREAVSIQIDQVGAEQSLTEGLGVIATFPCNDFENDSPDLKDAPRRLARRRR